MSAFPANFSMSQNQSVVIEYTVAAGNGATGFYALDPDGCTPGFPLAVGHEPSEVNSSDFPRFFDELVCSTLPQPQSQIVGYTGASIAYLTSERVSTLPG